MTLAAHRPLPMDPMTCGSLLGLVGGAALAVMAALIPFAAQAQCATEIEPNDTPETAVSLPGNACLSGSFVSGDQEIIRLRLDTDSLVRFDLTGPAGQETRADLFAFSGDPPTAGVRRYTQVAGGPAPDLVLPAGEWLIGLSSGGGLAGDWQLTPVVTPVPVSGPDLWTGITGTLVPGQALSIPLLIDEGAARRRYALTVETPPGEMVQITITGPSGARMLDIGRPSTGPFSLGALGLDTGDYVVGMTALSAQPLPFRVNIAAEGPRIPGREDEPNDRPESARVLTSGQSVTAVLTESDTDIWRLNVAAPMAGDAARLAALSLESPEGGAYSFCLRDVSGIDLQCRTGAAPALPDLDLQPGSYFVAVTGSASPDGYQIALRPGDIIRPGLATEPNDTAAQARPLAVDPTTGAMVEGQLAGPETDRFLMTLTGAPQLWQVTATGAMALRVEDAAGLTLAQRFYPDAEGRIVIGDLYLAPGPVILAVDGLDSRYTLSALPLGAPEAGAEQEPNDTAELALRLRHGIMRTGRLGDAGDTDMLRFSLWHDAPVALELDLPEGGAAQMTMRGGGLDLYQPLDGTGFAMSQTLPAGYYEITLATTLDGPLPRWSARLDWGDPLGAAGPPTQVELALADPLPPIASYWPMAQRFSGVLTVSGGAGLLTLDSATVLPGVVVTLTPATLDLVAGTSAEVAFSVTLPPDLITDPGLPIVLRATDDSGAETRLRLDLAITPDAAPLGSFAFADPPLSMQGGLNLASAGFGARLPGEAGLDPSRTTQDNPAFLFDGMASPIGFLGPAPGTEIRVDFGPADGVPVAGFVLMPQAVLGNPWQGQLRDVEIALSPDGRQFKTVWQGTLGAAPAASLRLLTGTGGDGQPAALAEWKVIAVPGWPEGYGVNLADPLQGGHIARADPLPAQDEVGLDAILLPGDAPATVSLNRVTPEIVVGFAGSRRAQVADITWQDTAFMPDPTAIHWPEVTVFAGDTPAGPWSRLGILSGSDPRRLTLPTPVTARYIRFAAQTPVSGGLLYPAQISVSEATGQPSSAGEWGMGGAVSAVDLAMPDPVPLFADAGEDDSLTAPRQIAWGATVTGQVTRGADTDHWQFTAPSGQDRTEISLTGVPNVLAALRLTDAAGAETPLRRLPGSAGVVRFEAQTIPGQSHTISVEEPQRSIVIAVDVSGSLGSFWPAIRAGLSAMAEGLVPGRDFVRILPFEQDFVGSDWTDDPVTLRRTLAELSMLSTGSGLEPTMIRASDALGNRDGLGVVLALTDGATASLNERPRMWAALQAADVQVFAGHVGGWDNPRNEARLLQDLSRLGGGHYAHLQTQAAIDVTLERVAAWTRRPALYGLTVRESDAPPPEPARLVVLRGEGGSLGGDQPGTAAPAEGTGDVAAPDPGALAAPSVALILDASGSMLQSGADGRRIDVARRALASFLTDNLPDGTPVALRTFGDTAPDSCATNLRVPLMPLNREYLAGVIGTTEPVNLAKTPIAESLIATQSDLSTATGPRIVVLVTDGEETCDGDPAAAIRALRDAGLDVTVNIVGFAVGDAALAQTFTDWAALGGGTYFPANDEAALTDALTSAAGQTYVVRPPGGGDIVATGTVGGAPVTLPAGRWQVELGAQATLLPIIEIDEGEVRTLILPAD